MKKINAIGLATVIAVVGLLSLTSCKVTPDQVKAIANAVGLSSAVGWITIDNPSTEAKQSVITIVSVIEDKAKSVSTGETYSAVLYPELVKVIDAQVPEQYRALCKLGTSMLLGQLDLLFIAHPEWKQDQDLALGVTIAFCAGAKQGLMMADTELPILQAKKNATLRSSIAK